jgi:hypothetical protein
MSSIHTTGIQRQAGKSVIVNLLVLALVGYGIFIGIQYVPQYLEEATVKSILDQVADRNVSEPFGNEWEVQTAINNQLNVNQLNKLRDNFKVSGPRGKLVVSVDYERELNLLYTVKKIHYHDEVNLY